MLKTDKENCLSSLSHSLVSRRELGFPFTSREAQV